MAIGRSLGAGSRLLILILCLGLGLGPLPRRALAADDEARESREAVDESLTEGALPIEAGMPFEQPIDPDAYIVGVGDQLVVHFWGERDRNIPLVVSPEGFVFLPNIGLVPATGKTLTQVKREVRGILARNYQQLRYDVFLVRPRSFLLHVLGHVKSPGRHPAQATSRVSEIVARAGLQGSRRRIEIWRQGQLFAKADLFLYERFGELDKNPFVLDDDRIFVPYHGRVVNVGGEVRSPGQYELLDEEDLRHLLTVFCGGPTREASFEDPAAIVRRNQENQLARIEFDLRRVLDDPAASAELPLEDGDSILIPSVARYQKLVRVEGAVYGRGQVGAGVEETPISKRQIVRETVGYYEVVEGEMISQLIAKAGGTMPWADLRNCRIERRDERGAATRTIPVDLERILVHKDYTADVPVLAGDTIVVPTTDENVYVVGEVVAPGPKDYLTNYRARDYLNMAGGASARASLWRARILHADGSEEKYRPLTVLQPGDVVQVPEKTFKFWQDYWTILAGAASIALTGFAVYFAAEAAQN